MSRSGSGQLIFAWRAHKVWILSPRHAVEATRSLPLPSGVEHGPDGAAGVDEMEGDDDSDVAPHGVCKRRSPHEDPPPSQRRCLHDHEDLHTNW